MRHLAKVLIALVILTAACSDDDEPASSSTSTSSSTTVEVPGSIGPGATSTTSAGQSPGITRQTTPDGAAVHLFQAWKRGDRRDAARFSSSSAVDSLFAHPYAEPEPAFDGCAAEADHHNCTYRAGNYTLLFRVEGGASAGYRVERVDYIET